MLTVEKIESTMTSMKLVLPPPADGRKITKSNARPFALCTVVNVTGAWVLRSLYASSVICKKSKRPSYVGFSYVKYSSICSFTDTAVANHSEPF